MTIGLGSGRAVFALAAAIGGRWDGKPPIKAVTASEATASKAVDAGIEIVGLDEDTRLDIAFDGADEIDHRLHMIKGGGAALLREKLVINAAERVIIFAEAKKYVEHLGTNWKLPVEVVRFGWTTTRRRLLALSETVEIRRGESGEPLITDENHHILDITLPDSVMSAGTGSDEALREYAGKLKATLGVVEHGLFLDEAQYVIFGNADGTVQIVERQDAG